VSGEDILDIELHCGNLQPPRLLAGGVGRGLAALPQNQNPTPPRIRALLCKSLSMGLNCEDAHFRLLPSSSSSISLILLAYCQYLRCY